MQLKLELKNKYKCANLKNDSYEKCHSRPRFCFCLDARVLAVMCFFSLERVETNEITVKQLNILSGTQLTVKQ